MSTRHILAVDDTPDAASDRPFVTAVLAARDAHLPWLRTTLDAVLAQEHRPDRLVVVDGTPAGGLRETLTDAVPELRALDLTVVKAPHDEAFAALVDRAVQSLPARPDDHVIPKRDRRRARPRETHPGDRHAWLWLLHEDSAPTPQSLAALLRAVGRSDRLGIVGCKINELDRPERLVNVGIDVTVSGRHVSRTHDGELDQGQHDGRRDVLAVASAGMLVRQDVYLELGGFDPAFDGDGDGLDLCWRAHLAGHAVAVVPEAVAHQDLDAAHLLRVMEARGTRMTRRQRRALTRRAGDPDCPAPHSGATLRRHRQVALARTSWWRLPFAWLWTIISSSVLAVLLLLLKRPRLAAAELAQAGAGFGLGKIIAARRRFRGRAVVTNAQLSAVFVPASAGRAAAWDAVVEALTPAGSRQAVTAVNAETGPTSDDADDLDAGRGFLGRALRHPGMWSVLGLVAIGVVLLRLPLERGVLGEERGLAGGSLDPFFVSASDVWHSWRDAWQGPGFGHAATSVPYLPFLALGAWFMSAVPGVSDATAGQTFVTALFVAAPALAGWSAFLAGRAATLRPWPRAAAALAWGSLATTTTAVGAGRLGPLVAAIVLPLLLAGLAKIARVDAGAGTVAATALAATVVIAFAPALSVLVLAGLAVVLATGSRPAKLRALAVLVVVPLMLGRWSIEAVRDPARLIAGPGTLTDTAAGDPVAALFLHPGGAGSTPLWFAAPVLLAGLFGAVRGRLFGAARWSLVLLALAGLGAAVCVPRFSLGAPQGFHVWSGLPLMVVGLALIALGLLGSEQEARPATRRAARATVARWSAIAATLLMAAVAGLSAWKAADRLAVTATRNPMPAIAEHDALSSRASMLLDLAPRSGALTYTVRSRESGLPAFDAGVTAMQTPPTVAKAVAALGDDASDRADLARTLRDAGISYVSVESRTDANAAGPDLSLVDGLTPMASGDGRTLYHVDGDDDARAARVVTTDGTGRVVVPVVGQHARVSSRLPAGGPNRRLVVAAAPGFADVARVTLDGRRLAPVAGAPMPTYVVGASGGHLVVEPGTAWSFWRISQMALLGVVAFLALPFGSARSRERA